jgi:hypothetical protein
MYGYEPRTVADARGGQSSRGARRGECPAGEHKAAATMDVHFIRNFGRGGMHPKLLYGGSGPCVTTACQKIWQRGYVIDVSITQHRTGKSGLQL